MVEAIIPSSVPYSRRRSEADRNGQRRTGRGQLTIHDLLRSPRDWCAEATAHPREVAEQALAHALPDKVEAAYRRGDMLEKRRRLMEEWAAFCGEPRAAGEVGPSANALHHDRGKPSP